MVDSNFSSWWDQIVANVSYVSCQEQSLGCGLLVGDILPDTITFLDEAFFRSYCKQKLPVYNAARSDVAMFPVLDVVTDDWKRYLMQGGCNFGSFKASVFSVILSITSNFVITISLTLLIFLNIDEKRYKHTSRLLKLGSLISSINMATFVSRALIKMQKEHEKYGVATVNPIFSMYSSDLTFTILDLISVFMIQFCQVTIVNRLFSRNLEKRMVVCLGVPLVVLSNVLWAIPRFANSAKNTALHREPFAPFVYLFRIALSTSYACTIIWYVIIKRRFCICSFQMALLTLLAKLVVLFQPALFLTVASELWLSGAGELFNTTCYLGSAYIVWEWLDRLKSMERNEQAQSILGRPIYEDEQQDYQIASYALEMKRALGKNYDDGDEFESSRGFLQDVQGSEASCSLRISNSENSRESFLQVRFNQRQPLKDVVKQRLGESYRAIILYVRQLKRVGIQSVKFKSKKKAESNEREQIVRKRIGLDKVNEVYVYSTKDIVFESDGE